jgi:hypothetical protein
VFSFDHLAIISARESVPPGSRPQRRKVSRNGIQTSATETEPPRLGRRARGFVTGRGRRRRPEARRLISFTVKPSGPINPNAKQKLPDGVTVPKPR